MATITRGAKAGGGTGFNAGQTIDPAEVNTDFNTVYTEFNGNIANVNVLATAAIALTKGAAAGARVYNSANISVSDNTDTLLTFDTERYDTDAFHSTSTNTGRLTIPTGFGGRYLLTGHVSIAAGTDYSSVYIWIRLNGATIIALHGETPSTFSFPKTLSIATLYTAVATDYFELLVNQDNTAPASRNCTASANYSPEFSITLVGA